MKRIAAFLRERAAIGDGTPTMLEGGASFAYVFGKVLVFLLLVEALTGAALAAFYSPSTTDAWASVAYIQDQSTWGWLVRGLHHHGGGALVVVAGLHLVQTAIAGAYKRPRELVWWLGVLLLVLTLAWAVTGFVLRWDQEGYWANRVELGIAAGTPVIGGKLRELALGGNDYGNLTLTRFYSLHAMLLPGVVLVVTIAHVWLAKKHGTTAVRSGAAVPRWPDQAVRDAFAMALALAILLAYVISQHGEGLAAPADPSASYDARPLWYFRWLFELRNVAGSAEGIVALVVPAIVGGYLVVLPLADRSPDRAPRARLKYLGPLAALLAVIAALTVMSFWRDFGDDGLAKRRDDAGKLADRARSLAAARGVPVTGALDVFTSPPMWRARAIYAQKCRSCHEDPKDRKGPVIRPGHGNREWLRAFLLDPSGDAFWGRTKFVADGKHARELEEKAPKPPDEKKDDKKDEKKDEKKDDKKDDKPVDSTMQPVSFDAKSAELDALVEFLYAESGATDADKAKTAHGRSLFEDNCTDCHAVKDGVAGSSGPNLLGLGSRDYYTSFIGNPKKAIHMTEDWSEMPRFDKELTLVERDLLAQYLVWLRGASKADLEALGPL